MKAQKEDMVKLDIIMRLFHLPLEQWKKIELALIPKEKKNGKQRNPILSGRG